MVRDIEQALNARIERRRVPGFDYGDLAPESLFLERPAAQRRSTARRRTRRPHTRSRRFQ